MRLEAGFGRHTALTKRSVVAWKIPYDDLVIIFQHKAGVRSLRRRQPRSNFKVRSLTYFRHRLARIFNLESIRVPDSLNFTVALLPKRILFNSYSPHINPPSSCFGLR